MEMKAVSDPGVRQDAVLGIPVPLGIPETVIGPVVSVALEFVLAVYKSILVRDETQVIDKDAMLKSARDDIPHRQAAGGHRP